MSKSGFIRCQNNHALINVTNTDLYRIDKLVCKQCGIVVKDRYGTSGTVDPNWQFGCLKCGHKINGLTQDIALCWKCEISPDITNLSDYYHYTLNEIYKSLGIPEAYVNGTPNYYNNITTI